VLCYSLCIYCSYSLCRAYTVLCELRSVYILSPVCFIELDLLPIKVLHAGIGIFNLFGSYDLDLHQMPFIYEVNLYPLETYSDGYANYERLTSRLSFGRYRMKSSECVRLVMCGYFRSCDKDGSPPFDLPYWKTHATCKPHGSLMEPELGAIEVLHCRNRNF